MRQIAKEFMRCCLTRIISSSGEDMHACSILFFFQANYVHLCGIVKFAGLRWVGGAQWCGRKQLQRQHVRHGVGCLK